MDLLIIVAFNLILYFPALRCQIIVDDVRNYKRHQDKDYAWSKFGWKRLWPFIRERLYGGSTFGCLWSKKIGKFTINAIEVDHLFALTIHLAICLLMYHDFHSLWAVLLYSSASLTMHTAVWLNGRRYAINILLTLLIVAFGKIWWVALPLYFITPWFHLTALFAPILFMPWWGLALAPVVLFIFRKRIIPHIKGRLEQIFECDRKYFKPTRIIVIIKTYGFYFFKMIVPGMTRVCYGFLYTWGETPEGDRDAYAFNMDFFKGICALVLSFIIPYFFQRDLWLFWAFTILSTLQWCNIICATQIVADRYVCLPNLFMCLFLSRLLPHPLVIGLVVYNVCCIRTSFRCFVNIPSMFQYHFYHCPFITLVNKEYIAFCIKTGDYIKAYTLTKECLSYNPNDFALLHAACVCAKAANDRKMAREYADRAEKHLYIGQEQTQLRWLSNFRQGL